jgi:hypothetical protein
MIISSGTDRTLLCRHSSVGIYVPFSADAALRAFDFRADAALRAQLIPTQRCGYTSHYSVPTQLCGHILYRRSVAGIHLIIPCRRSSAGTPHAEYGLVCSAYRSILEFPESRICLAWLGCNAGHWGGDPFILLLSFFISFAPLLWWYFRSLL